jgi:hypothetical protein
LNKYTSANEGIKIAYLVFITKGVLFVHCSNVQKGMILKRIFISALFGVMVSLPIVAHANGWQQAHFVSSEMLATGGSPVIECTYALGFGNDGYKFKARMSAWSCPWTLWYNVELDKWRN